MTKLNFDPTTLAHIKEILEWGNFEPERYLEETEPEILIGQLVSIALGRVRALEEETNPGAEFLDSLNRKIPVGHWRKQPLFYQGLTFKEVADRLAIECQRERKRADDGEKKLSNIRQELEKLARRHYQFGRALLNSLDEIKFWVRH